MNMKKYEFTLAEYERIYLSKPENQIWESVENRFEGEENKRIYVNIKKMCLVHSIRNFNPNFLWFPKIENPSGRGVQDMTVMIQILNNREKREDYIKKGMLYKWREFYSNCIDEEMSDSVLVKTVDLSILEESKNIETHENFIHIFKHGGLVFIDDSSNPDYLKVQYLSLLLMEGLHNNLKKYPINDLNLDDIADN